LKIPTRGGREEESAKKAIWCKILLRSVIPSRNHPKEDLRDFE
jgi:hypothetical protein